MDSLLTRIDHAIQHGNPLHLVLAAAATGALVVLLGTAALVCLLLALR